MKDNNKSVNDIFQNDNSSKNKTKTILLLTIVAIILISVFLIIAWVMTRDNPLQDIQKDQESTINQTKERILPYAHNVENENPFGIDTNKNIVPPSEEVRLPETAMSNTPPIGVPTSIPAASETENKNVSKVNEFENDERFQAALKDLEKQHADKKNADAKKETESSKTKEQPQAKVVTPSAPKETTIVAALDPTKSTQKAKDSDKASQKPQAKEQTKPEPIKTSTQTSAQKQKDSDKQVAKPQPKQAEPANKSATTQKPAVAQNANAKGQDNKVMQRPQNNIVSENQGKSPEKGHYVQVGAFTAQDKITPEFLNKIAKYNYRILKVEQNGVASAKYLIGPYKTREEVKQIETKIRTEINQGAFYVDRTK